ncbi:DUF2092 domain-containing protein [Hyphomicrobium sp. CS1GBMeth3]|uniref:DUF2092 domain-containing protein n=1 Tax=Hyphomicrobium sp. CS1GBMeth3 TaxID=1892845 RepID=UPI00092FDDF9|nr:DUF2092 domain-containing protein [Hyphomicrobium sp. CS1GBMeth3]
MRLLTLAFCAICFAVCGEPGRAQTNPDATVVELDGANSLQRMREYFAHAPEIEFQTSFRETSDLPGMGQHGTAHYYIRKPRSFRVELSSSKGNYIFVSDGTTFTMYRPKTQKYARMPAGNTIVGTMYLGIGLLGVQAKLIDFIWAVGDSEQISLKSIGLETIGGKSCDHLSVQRFEHHWDVWIRRDGIPAPCKIVNRSLDSNDNSVQRNELVWAENPAFRPDLFVFVPPAGAVEVWPSEFD